MRVMSVSISEMWKPVESRDVTLIQTVTYWTFIVKELFSQLTGGDASLQRRDL